VLPKGKGLGRREEGRGEERKETRLRKRKAKRVEASWISFARNRPSKRKRKSQQEYRHLNGNKGAEYYTSFLPKTKFDNIRRS